MNIAINKIHFPVTTLGYGRRIGIWTQGCTIRCPGCLNRDTWAPDPRKHVMIDTLMSGLSDWLAQADGVTVSGGEPFDQPDALGELLAALRKKSPGDILVYSGYSRPLLEERHPAVLACIDVLISEPFDENVGDHLALRGSDNQRIALLSPLAHERYPGDLDTRPAESQRRLDMVTVGNAIWLAGIPRRMDLVHLREALSARGYHSRTTDQPLIRA